MQRITFEDPGHEANNSGGYSTYHMFSKTFDCVYSSRYPGRRIRCGSDELQSIPENGSGGWIYRVSPETDRGTCDQDNDPHMLANAPAPNACHGSEGWLPSKLKISENLL
ncbi:unnamed protein product [Adineta ricciae]|uniref:Uncharacterized protein n=1 Tax=Adineta ricciae TaxID=249248 RepID=A0A815CY97_ADIRI|nr:unnamed protein product [Adineta ricciae]CAF1289788.1 unnamed protein product [Adineta ricciae]